MPLKEVALSLAQVTVLPRREELQHLAVAVVSAFESHLGRHPVDLGAFRKLSVSVGNAGRHGPLPVIDDLDRVAVVHLPAVADDLVGLPPAEQADLLLRALVAGIDVAASHVGVDVDVKPVAELVRLGGFRTEITERRRDRGRTRQGTFRGVIDLEETVLTLTATVAATGDVLAEQRRRFRADHWDLTQYARALRWEGDELVIRTKEFTTAKSLHWRVPVA